MRAVFWWCQYKILISPSFSYNGRSLGLNRHLAHIWQYQTLALEQAKQFVRGTIRSGLDLNIYEELGVDSSKFTPASWVES